MLRAEMLWMARGPTLKLEGRLVGEWAERARALVTTNVVPKGLILDLTAVTYIDAAGERLLSWLGSVGAVFLASGVYATDICELLSLSPKQRTAARCHASKRENSPVTNPQVGAGSTVHNEKG